LLRALQGSAGAATGSAKVLGDVAIAHKTQQLPYAWRMSWIGFAATIVSLLVAVLHTWFFVLEMFLWEHPIGLKTFKNTAETAKITKVLAANQGLYNGFLAAGLAWGILQGSMGWPIQAFFLCCAVVAGVYGALSVSTKILYVQALPAAVGLVLLWLYHRG
jgi:putative membrane protein